MVGDCASVMMIAVSGLCIFKCVFFLFRWNMSVEYVTVGELVNGQMVGNIGVMEARVLLADFGEWRLQG